MIGATREGSPAAAPDDVAVIGMSARLPGAPDVAALWRNLAAGRDAVTEIPHDRWDHAPWYDPDPGASGKIGSRWGGFIDGIAAFDPLFFNISPLEAEWMDPQHRLFLQEAWRALEDAGCAPDSLDGTRCGVFIGCKEAEYLNGARGMETNGFALGGSSMAMLPARLSYFLNLKGPAVPVNTACSSSLVAVHLACESLRSGACDLAIAGGVALMLSARTHLALGKAGLLSPRGRCATFDDDADGIAIGEGVGVVVLARLERALNAGHPVHGVIRASAINQDGRTNGITAPSAPSQTALAHEVYGRAGISPETITYVEAHGTGTRLGDPIEVQALTDAFQRFTSRRGFCALGAAKTNFGHTLEASGIAGLIKILLCLRHRTLVPSLHYQRPNRHLDFTTTPFFVNTELRDWEGREHPRRAALSAFGFSGTNAHLVLEEGPGVDSSRADSATTAARSDGGTGHAELFVLSAKSAAALRRRVADLVRWLDTRPGGESLADAAFTLQAGRAHHPFRVAFAASDRTALRRALETTLAGAVDAAQIGAWPETPAPVGIGDGALRRLGDALVADCRQRPTDAAERARRLAVLGGLYVKGYNLDWTTARGQRQRVVLPPYPFEQRRCWFDAAIDVPVAVAPSPAAPAAPTPASVGDAGEPLIDDLRRVLAELLRLESDLLGADDELLAFGFSSLLGMKLIARIEERHGVRLTHSALLEARTLRSLCDQVVAARTAAPGAPDVRPAPTGSRAEVAGAPESARWPLSIGQRALWLLQALAPGSTAYHVPCALRWHGTLDVTRLRAALSHLWRRHPMLRARIAEDGDVPIQVIDPDGAPPFTVHAPTDEPGALLARLVEAPFDLRRGPLARIDLLAAAGDQAPILLFTAHHLVVDGSSVAVLVRELAQLYDAGSESVLASLPAPSASFAAFVEWQRQMLETEAAERHRAFWRARLAHEPPALTLPYDHPEPSTRRAGAAVHASRVDADLSTAVRRLATREGIYPFILWLAALEVLLARYGQQDDVVVGTAVAGRARRELEEVVGYFVNVIPIRNRVPADASFLTFARALQAAHAEALDHADLPFAEIARLRGGGHDGARRPLVQVQLVFQNWVDSGAAGSTLPTTGIRLEPLLEVVQKGEMELSFEIVELGDRAHLNLKYDPDRFDAATTARMADHYREVLAAATREPHRAVGALDILPRDERQKLQAWNRTERPFLDQVTVHELFEAQARRTPEAVAVSFGGESLTYAALDERSNRLAGTLVATAPGVGAGAVVAVLAERSLDLCVALFSALKSGAAYLPIDPQYPADRIRYMIEDSRACALLLAGGARAPAGFAGPTFDLRDPSVYAADGTHLVPRAGATDLAYVIYTSGSTGRPKGVMIEHRGLINRLTWMQRRYPIGPDDVILQKTPVTFDVSVWELFWWSLHGARLELLAPGAERDPGAIAEAIARAGVTVMHFVPSALSVFLEHARALPDLRGLATMRQVFASGEALTVAQVARFNQLLHSSVGVKLANLYGPTEASIDVSFFDCSDADTHALIPIGRPIDNMRLYVVDGALALSPIGVPGELCIAGVGLARGYVNKPALDAERFVEAPFAAGERLYRTGDRARVLPDGNIEYLGRLDRQVKLRGMRVELGEIEAALNALPGVRDACVVTSPDGGSLIAYWVGEPECGYSAQDLRDRLAETLPGHMLPAATVRLPALPQTAHGKVDHGALPAPDHPASEPSEAWQSGIEGIVAEVLGALLGGRTVGRRDNFFEVGGHSLLLATAAIRLGARLGRAVPVAALFEHPTVEALARELTRDAGAPADAADAVPDLASSVGRGARSRQRLTVVSAALPARASHEGINENGVHEKWTAWTSASEQET